MKKVILISFLFLHYFTFSQKDTSKTHRWFISLIGTPSHDFMVYHPTSFQPPDNINGLPIINGNLRANKHWHGGILFSFNILKALNIQTGITIDQQGYKTTQLHDTAFSRGHSILDIGTFYLEYRYTYIGVPLKIGSEIKLNKNISVLFDAGINFNFCFGAKQIVNVNANYFQDGNGYGTNFLNNSVNCGIGIRYMVENVGISLKPNFNYFLSKEYAYKYPSFNDGYYSMNFYSIGVELGLQFKLGKKTK